MKTIWKYWKAGWPILGRIILFFIVVWVICLPAQILEYFLNSNNMAIFEDGAFHWQSAVSFLLFIVLFPIGLSVAQRETGYFRKREDKEQNKRLEDIGTNAPNPQP